jgi:hypothetical protein
MHPIANATECERSTPSRTVGHAIIRAAQYNTAANDSKQYITRYNSAAAVTRQHSAEKWLD